MLAQIGANAPGPGKRGEADIQDGSGGQRLNPVDVSSYRIRRP
jgi:hypothetical protein